MARLYSRLNATVVDDPEFGCFEIQDGKKDRDGKQKLDHGGFDFPDELSDRQIRVHHRGKPAWETEIERDDRLHGEETARRRDPESAYLTLEKIAALGESMSRPQGGADSGEVAELRKQVAELNARFAAMQDQDDDGEAAQPKPSRSRKPAST